MIGALTQSSAARSYRSTRSADGAAWRIKPEVRTVSQIIVERQILEARNVTREWIRITRGVNLSNPF